MNRMMMVMVAAIAVLSVFSGIGPVSMKVWFIEMIWAWGLVGVLALTWQSSDSPLSPIRVFLCGVYCRL